MALAPAAPARAEEPPGDQAPSVGLDQLLRLPSSVTYETEERGGAGESEWRARFLAARAEIESARESLDKALKELEKAAAESDSWQVSAPGTKVAAGQDGSVSYRLRQEIRNQREALALAEDRLRELEIEANLASVPEAWKR
jgi:hypothetical protein